MIHEMLYNDDKTGPFAAAAYSVAMLLWTEGVQRSLREHADILLGAGFTDVTAARTFGGWSIVSARRP